MSESAGDFRSELLTHDASTILTITGFLPETAASHWQSMFRLGIRRFDQYSPQIHGMKWWLTKGCLSYELLSAVHSHGPEGVALFEAIVRDLRLSLGICRTTARGRFRALDPVVNQELVRHFGPVRELNVHDWAASDCLTSSEWARSLFTHFPQAAFTASDLLLYLVELTLPGKDILILEPSGGPVQYIRGPLVCYLDRTEAKSAVVNRVLASYAHRLLDRRGTEFRKAIDVLGNRQSATAGELRLTRLPLVHPDAEQLAETDPRFAVRTHSAFEPLSKPVDVIRTMNIFNPGYFPPERLRAGRDTVWTSLKPGGIWIVGRTNGTSPESASHTASLFVRTDEGFRTVAEVGGGSEIASLVLEPRPVTAG